MHLSRSVYWVGFSKAVRPSPHGRHSPVSQARTPCVVSTMYMGGGLVPSYNQIYMNPKEVEKRKILTRLFVLFCRQLMKLQIAHGGRTMFEHPKDSVAWDMLVKHFPDMHVVDLHMCQYGLAIPGGGPIRKPTRLLVSHRDMCVLSRLFPDKDDPQHAHHQVIAGTVPSVGAVSKFAGIYPPPFFKTVLVSHRKRTSGLLQRWKCKSSWMPGCLSSWRLECRRGIWIEPQLEKAPCKFRTSAEPTIVESLETWWGFTSCLASCPWIDVWTMCRQCTAKACLACTDPSHHRVQFISWYRY